MSNFLAQTFGMVSAEQLLSPGEALLLLLVLVSVVVLSSSTLLAGGAIALRAHRSARERTTKERFLLRQGALHRVLYDGAQPETVWSVVEESSDEEFLDFLLLYVRRLEGAERDLVCTLAEPHLPAIARLATHRSEGRRMRAVQTLGELGLPKYGEQVISALDDPSPLVAMVAAGTLARAETAHYAGEVLARLDRFSHWRGDFLTAMLASMGPGAAPGLRACLENHEATTRVRAVAADALAMLSDPVAANIAAKLVGFEVEMELRAAALRLLASVGRAEHLPAVRASVGSAELPVRLTAVRALGSLGLREDLPTLETAAREDPSPWVAIAAARAMKEAGGVEALEALAGSEHPRSALGLQVISESRSW